MGPNLLNKWQKIILLVNHLMLEITQKKFLKQ
jgi:hypothetical protein